VPKLISWKHSFRRLAEEYALANKKKQALDNLLNTEKISKSTYDLFNDEIDQAIMEIERQQKTLLEKMNSKSEELEAQIKTLEMLFVNFEIQHVTGEVNEEVYQREIDLLSVGLDEAKHELDTVKDAMSQLSGDLRTPVNIEFLEQDNEVSQPEIEVIQAPPSTVESKESQIETQENQQETPQNTEESCSTETQTEGKQEQTGQ
jgi:histone deacetylase complex regulatory component SIN3